MGRKHRAGEEKIRIIMESLTTSIGTAELCRKYGVLPQVFYGWKEKFVEGGKNSLLGRRKNGSRDLEEENEKLKKLIGELTIANDVLKKVVEGGKRR